MSASTLLPFLYQTQTLQRLSHMGTRIPLIRAFSHTAPSRVPRAPRRPPDDMIPFELPTDFKPRKEEVGEADGPEEGEANTASGRGTITEREREAFGRIFDEMAQLHKPPPAPPTLAPKTAGSGAPYPTDESDIDKFLKERVPGNSDPADPALGRATIGAILQHAVDPMRASGRRSTAHFDKLHPLGQVAASADPVKALLRFPPSLRDAARRALGILDASIDDDAQDETPRTATEEAAPGDGSAQVSDKDASDPGPVLNSASIALEIDRRKERYKVEKLMEAALTDRELWRVMEEHVFSMVKKLGLDEITQGADATTKNEQPAMKLYFHGPLYPSWLLFGLRLFDQRFARSSPLCLNLLPRVKELGLASYLLGMTTSFYNALGTIYWSRYGNASAVLDLFEEMRYAGLYFDENTQRLVQRIDQFQQMAMGSRDDGRDDGRDDKRRPAPFVQAIANMPDNRLLLQARIRHWRKAIAAGIEERNRALGLEFGFADPDYQQSVYKAQAPKSWEL